MRSIALQCLLAMTYRPDLLSTEELPSTHRRPLRPGQQDTVRHPRWLGKDYRRPKAVSKGGFHASPRKHWRKSHWRRVPIGKGRLERKWVWIETT